MSLGKGAEDSLARSPSHATVQIPELLRNYPTILYAHKHQRLPFRYGLCRQASAGSFYLSGWNEVIDGKTFSMNYWLMKSEPGVYSIADLQQQGETIWDGVRNYQARNFLREMNLGDLAFFYHSNITPPGIVGLMRVVKTSVADPTQFDPNSPYYDAKSTALAPRWQTVGVEFVESFPNPIFLETLKQEFSAQELWVTRRGNRLSVMPVEEVVALKILAIARSLNDS